MYYFIWYLHYHYPVCMVQYEQYHMGQCIMHVGPLQGLFPTPISSKLCKGLILEKWIVGKVLLIMLQPADNIYVQDFFLCIIRLFKQKLQFKIWNRSMQLNVKAYLCFPWSNSPACRQQPTRASVQCTRSCSCCPGMWLAGFQFFFSFSKK